MRRATHDTQFVIEDDKFVGINLGWDFVSEHEWGISRLLSDFGIPKEPTTSCFGFDARTTQCQSDNLCYLENGDDTFLVNTFNYNAYKGESFTADDLERMIGRSYGKPEHGLCCAWDGQSFGIRTNNDEGRDMLKLLHMAFKNNNIAIFLGGRGGNPFSNSGLMLIIANEIPQDARDSAANSDLSHFRLTKAAEATGIEAKLKKAGKSWYALSPRWTDETEQELKFWLNPEQQHKYNSRWCTVEELEQWAEDKGPIVK